MDPQWKKSSFSAQNGHCVEVAELDGHLIGVRDSKDNAPGCPVLTFDADGWRSFLAGLAAGEFDHPADGS